MRKILSILVMAALCAAPLTAQTHVVPVYSYPSAGTPGVVILQCDANADNCTPLTAANPLQVTTSSGSGASAGQTQGNAASAAADVGNPVKTGCVFNSPPPTVTAGQRVDCQADANGGQRVKVTLASSSASDTFSNSAIGFALSPVSASSTLLLAQAGYVFNGTSWDRLRGDTTGQYVVEVPSASTNAGVSIAATSAVASSLVVKASAGNLYGYNVTSGASAGYVMIFNATTAPADGAVTPVRCIPLAANTGLEIDLRGQPTFFPTGIVIVFSTTGCFTKTASATAFIAGDAK